jgi:hypothetical protein
MGLFDIFKKKRKEEKQSQPVQEAKPAAAPVKQEAPKPVVPAVPARKQANIQHPFIITKDGIDYGCLDSYGITVKGPQYLDRLSLYQEVTFREENGVLYVCRNELVLGTIDGSYKEYALSCDYPFAMIEVIDIAKNELGISIAFYNNLADCPYMDFPLVDMHKQDHMSGNTMYDIIADDVQEDDAVSFVYDEEHKKVLVQATGCCAMIGYAGDADAQKLIRMRSPQFPEWVCGLLGKVVSISKPDADDNSTIQVMIRAYNYLADF